MLTTHAMTFITRRLSPGATRLFVAGVGGLALLLLGGCSSLKPQPLTEKEITSRVDGDRAGLFAYQEPVARPISLSEAIARAVKYNLDQRVRLLEEALARGQFDLAMFDFLPQANVYGGWDHRSKPSASISKTLGTDTVYNDPSISAENESYTATGSLTYHLLDFGISYARAKQAADEVLITWERKRQSLNDLTQNVRYAYWRALGAQMVTADLNRLIQHNHALLLRANQRGQNKTMAHLDSLTYQRALAQSEQQLLQTRHSLYEAKADLASLMNMPPGANFTLALPKMTGFVLPRISDSLDEMERIALANRPELREEDYLMRMEGEEVRMTYLRMLPGLDLDLNLNWDGNPYLRHQHWSGIGSHISYNLMNLLTTPMTLKALDAKAKVAEMRRMAISMGVITQVNLAHAQYRMLTENFELSKYVTSLNSAILENVRQTTGATLESQFVWLQEAVGELNSRLGNFEMYARIQQTASQIHAALGLDVAPPEATSRTLSDMTEIIAYNLEQIEKTGPIAFAHALHPPLDGHEGSPDRPWREASWSQFEVTGARSWSVFGWD